MLPTRRAGSRNSGSTTTESRASRHSMVIITASVETRVMPLVTISGSVPVTALCAPTTSLLKREMISPDLVWVKKRKRHALQMGVHRLPQVADDALAHAGAEVALRHADEPAEDRIR